MNQPTQHTSPQTEQAGGTLHGPLGAFDLLDACAERLFAADMMRVFGLSRSAFYRELKNRRFDQFEILPRIGRRMWSRALLRPYFAGHLRPDARWTRRVSA